PADYVDTQELIERCKVAALYLGKYISHRRSEGVGMREAIDEVGGIVLEVKVPAESYHDNFFFKAEDGKRDRNVTGVQTCALPISAGSVPACAAKRADPCAHGRRAAVRGAGRRRRDRRVRLLAPGVGPAGSHCDSVTGFPTGPEVGRAHV